MDSAEAADVQSGDYDLEGSAIISKTIDPKYEDAIRREKICRLLSRKTAMR
ncbi:MAG: hypothetical protein V8T10_08940 [Merdibacter sp.]